MSNLMKDMPHWAIQWQSDCIVRILLYLSWSMPVANYSLAQGDTQSTVRFQPEAVTREERKFEQIADPIQDDTPGMLKNGGYCWQDVLVTKRHYRALEKPVGGAQVETITHSRDYPFVIQDFYGHFRGAGIRRPPVEETEVIDGVVKEHLAEWGFLSWGVGGGTPGEKICIIVFPKKEGGYAGNVGWYTREGDQITTVMMMFDNLDGVPVQLIDEYLKQYPSSVKEEEFHGATWVADDVRKWVRLVELLRADRERFGFALSRLGAYDDKLFGLDRTKLQPADPVAFKRAIDDLTERAEQWLAEREKTRRSRGEK